MPRPVHLAGQRLRRRPDKCDAGPSSERTTIPSSRRKRQDSLSLSLVLFPPKPLRWVSAGALLGEVIKTPVLHFFGASMWGVVSLPSACASCCRNAGRPRVTVAYLPFLCRHSARPVWAEYPHGWYNATPAPNRAHSSSHAETRRVIRVDGDDVPGSGIIDTIDPFQADQPVAVALAEGHRNAVSP